MTGGEPDVVVRPARPGEADAVRRLLDAAMLTVPEDLPARVAAGDALVAVEASRESAADGGTRADGPADAGARADGASDDDAERTPVGALVRDGGRVEAVVVARSRRAGGVGSALVRAAAARVDGALTAEFRPAVRPFYESLGFAVGEADPDDPESDRLRGRLEP